MTEQGETIFHVELQQDSDGQFFKIPPELAFSTGEVILQREGHRLIITPAIQTAPDKIASKNQRQTPCTADFKHEISILCMFHLRRQLSTP